MWIVGMAVIMAMGVEEYREVRHDCQRRAYVEQFRSGNECARHAGVGEYLAYVAHASEGELLVAVKY